MNLRKITNKSPGEQLGTPNFSLTRLLAWSPWVLLSHEVKWVVAMTATWWKVGKLETVAPWHRLGGVSVPNTEVGFQGFTWGPYINGRKYVGFPWSYSLLIGAPCKTPFRTGDFGDILYDLRKSWRFSLSDNFPPKSNGKWVGEGVRSSCVFMGIKGYRYNGIAPPPAFQKVVFQPSIFRCEVLLSWSVILVLTVLEKGNIPTNIWMFPKIMVPPNHPF